MRRAFVVCFLAFGFLMTLSVKAQPNKQKELEERRQSILQDIQQINSLLFKTQGRKKSILTNVEDLDHKIRTRENLIRITNQQANLLTREINDNRIKIEKLERELQILKEDYAAMITKSYKSKSQQSRVMFLLSSENFFQAYKRLQYMKQYARHRKEQGENIEEKSRTLELLNSDLVEQKGKKQSLIEENRLAKEKLTLEKGDYQALVVSLRKDEGKFSSQIRKKQNEADAIDRQIEALIREAIAKSNKASSNTNTNVSKSSETFALTEEAKTLAANFMNNKGKLPWPVAKGVVVKRYGKQQHPQLPNVTTFNSGVEIATETNSRARAVFNGEVLEIQQLKGANKAIYIQHGNYITVYNNLSKINVKKGDKVSTKQEIGTIVTNGTSGKTILKFLIYQNTSRLNPADWIFRM